MEGVDQNGEKAYFTAVYLDQYAVGLLGNSKNMMVQMFLGQLSGAEILTGKIRTDGETAVIPARCSFETMLGKATALNNFHLVKKDGKWWFDLMVTE